MVVALRAELPAHYGLLRNIRSGLAIMSKRRSKGGALAESLRVEDPS